MECPHVARTARECARAPLRGDGTGPAGTARRRSAPADPARLRTECAHQRKPCGCRQRARTADRREPAVSSSAFQAAFHHFIEVERAAMGAFQCAGLAAPPAASFHAEKLYLHVFRCNCCRVQRHKRAFRALTLLVHQPGHHFLAGAGSAKIITREWSAQPFQPSA